MPIARLLFSLLVLSMALGQSLTFSAFVAAIESYQVAAPGVSRGIGLALILGETFAGIGLLAGSQKLRSVAGWAGLTVAAVWAGLAVQAFLSGLEIENCGCFGRYFAQRLSWLVLLQDVYFVGLAYLALRSALKRPSADLASA